MATHDYVIDNQSASAFRTDLNGALQAIVTQNSNATAPATTYANMFWYDTATNQLKKRNEANSAWIVLGTINEGAGTFTPSASITTTEIAASTLVTASDSIVSNDNDTTIPTCAAVVDYVDQYLILRSVVVDTSSAGAYVARTLGTTVKNTITGASVSSPTFTLPAGKYLFRAFAMGYFTSLHHIRLQNTTDATTTLVGAQSFSRNDSDSHPTPTAIDSYFEITGTKSFQVQHYAAIGGSSLASPSTDGTTMQTLSVIVQKVG